MGNLALARFVTSGEGAEFRVTHAADPVPRLPPLVLGFAHTSPEYWLRDDSSSLSPAAVGTGDVKVCEGHFAIGCNAGTLGFDPAAHTQYFGPITGCGGGEGTPWRRRRAGEEDLSDVELEALVNAWAEKDVEFAKALEQTA